jgi:hypothetical protein
MFFDSSFFSDNTVVLVVAQFSVGAAGFVLRLRSMIHVRLVSGAVDALLFCRLGGFRFLRSVRGKGVLPVQMRSDRRFSLRFQSEALKFSSDNRRLLSPLLLLCIAGCAAALSLVVMPALVLGNHSF